MREIINAIFYVLRAGCAWRMLPKCFPPMTTVYGWFLRFRREGLFATINHHLVMADRERVGREVSPSAAVIDSQSVRTGEAGGPKGYDAGKKIKGRRALRNFGSGPRRNRSGTATQSSRFPTLPALDQPMAVEHPHAPLRSLACALENGH